MIEQRLKSLFKDGQPPTSNAKWWDKLYLWFKWYLGALMDAVGFPAYIQPVDTYDHLTGTTIKVQVMELFVVISVNGNDYYFKRLSGKYDGSGTGVDLKLD